MRHAFTMIELIFIIVIIGILVAVAIPKLTATRSDAEAAVISSQLAICMGDAGGAYLKTKKFSGISGGAIDTLPLGSSSCEDAKLSTKNGELCYSISVSDASGSVSITEVGTSSACSKAHLVSQKNGISLLGGVQVLQF